MNQTQIRSQVNKQVERWKKLRKIEAEISGGGIDFLCLLVVNIQEDKSPAWTKLDENDSNLLQEEAIALIPYALDEVAVSTGTRNNMKISSWEIWHSLTTVLDKFCFIPKKRSNG